MALDVALGVKASSAKAGMVKEEPAGLSAVLTMVMAALAKLARSSRSSSAEIVASSVEPRAVKIGLRTRDGDAEGNSDGL